MPLKTEVCIRWAQSHFTVPVSPRKVRSGAHNEVYKLEAPDKCLFLKVGKDLHLEQERILWLTTKHAAVPKVVDFLAEDKKEALLISAIEGIDLAHLSTTWGASKVISSLASALRAFHVIDATDCPFMAYKSGDTLVHGDACLPNFMFKQDGSFSGYVDLLEMGVGSIEVDLAAAVWSLQFNLGAGYGLEFLQQYGWKDANELEAERLRLMYEQSPIFQR